MKLWLSCIMLVTSMSVMAQGKYLPEEGSTDEKKGDLKQSVENGLPNVLILGDSISISYTKHVKTLLKGKANVFRPMQGKRGENCQGTTLGLSRIDVWLEGRKWNVIHFNWGLHDLKHVKKAGTKKNSNSFDDPRQAEPDIYKKNLTAIVVKLKATGAKLVFATTTPFPDGVKPARLPADAKLYNDIAIEVMKANGVEVNDLYAFVEPQIKTLQKPENVHFSKAGSEEIAKQVVKAVEKHLK